MSLPFPKPHLPGSEGSNFGRDFRMFTADPKNQTQKTKGPEVSAASPGEAPDPDLNWGQERKKPRQLGGG